MAESTVRRAETLPTSAMAAAITGIGTAWIAAGSVGVLADPFRVVLTWVGLLATAAALPFPRRLWNWTLLAPLSLWLLPLAFRVELTHEMLLVAATLAALAASQTGAVRTVLAICARAALALVLFRLVCSSIPAVWLLGDWAAGAMGRAVGWLTGRPLHVGMSFAGFDYLVFMAVFALGWLRESERSVKHRLPYVLAAVIGAQFVYLFLLAMSVELLQRLPVPPEPAFVHPYVPLDIHWSTRVRQVVPWNVPLVGGVLHILIAALMLRWSRWPASKPHAAAQAGWWSAPYVLWLRRGGWCAIWLLPVALAFAVTYVPGTSDLAGKRLLANRDGFLDWRRPLPDQYGKPSAGMFGMLPRLVESLGGTLSLAEDFDPAELEDTDAVLLLHPATRSSHGVPPAADQHGADQTGGESPDAGISSAQVQKILDYVRRGGSLLVVGGPFQKAGPSESGERRILAGTKLAVRRDVAVPANARWQHALHAGAHAAAIDPRSNHELSDWGASLAIRWPASPVAIGRWGWSDFGSDAMLTGRCRLEPGERLGDLVLVAEQPFGAGRILVLGDDRALTNEGLVQGFDWGARLLGYLTHRSTGPNAAWRQVLHLVLCLGLLGVVLRCRAQQLLPIAVLLGIALPLSAGLNQRSVYAAPDGRRIADQPFDLQEPLDQKSPTPEQSPDTGLLLPAAKGRLAYIAAAHLEAFSLTDWHPDGINGLALTLMRQGYLALLLPELTSERLERAAVLISIALARPFERREQDRILQFVTGGGVWICTVGAEEEAGSRSLLARLGMHVPRSPAPPSADWREPEPMGRFRAAYGDAAGDDAPRVLFHAGWPVAAHEPGAEVWVTGKLDQPIIIGRRVGRGYVILIGDSGFALNKNLENINGEPLDGQYENSHFWRWLLDRLDSGQAAETDTDGRAR